MRIIQTKNEMIKFAVKVGLASTAVYFINQQGVWKTSNESVKTLNKLKETVNPYVQEVKSQIPIEFPEIPETDRLSSLAKLSWNRGVLATFKFISELPDTVSDWTSKGVRSAMENQEIKNFLGSFSSNKDTVEKK